MDSEPQFPNSTSSTEDISETSEKKPDAAMVTPRSVTTAASLIIFAIVCGLLYWGRSVAIPVALATLLSFMLNPLTKYLQRLRISRVVAAVVTVILFCSMAAGVAWTIGGQLSKLSQELPTYRKTIVQRVAGVRQAFQGGALDKIQTTMDQVADDLDSKVPEKPSFENPSQPVPVVITSSRTLLDFENIITLLPILEPLSMAGLVILLSALMMIRWDDLRSRLLSFSGQRNITVATRAMEDSGRKITRYLVVQALYNGGVGLVIGVGLYFIGLPYAALWGICAALFRYIPYAGPVVAAALPILHSLVVTTGWTQVSIVTGFFIVVELVSNNFIEPWLYGSKLGLSEIGVVISAVIWTFLWGPVGLMLATPLTVCLVVLGEYLPSLGFLPRLLGDKPVMETHFKFYQRLLAHDDAEIESITREEIKCRGFTGFVSEVVVPTLVLARNEERHLLIPASEAQAISNFVLQLIERHRPTAEADTAATAWSDKPTFIVITDSELASTVAKLLNAALDRGPCDLHLLSHKALTGEVVDMFTKESPAGFCLLSLDLSTPYRSKYLLRRVAALDSSRHLVLALLGRSAERAGVKSGVSWAGRATVVSQFEELRAHLTAMGSHSAKVFQEPEMAAVI